jgi:hypothetical protein
VDESTERWLPYPGYAGFYEVSDQGNVTSLPRQTTRGKLLKAQVNKKGYRQVGLSKYGKVTIKRVARMVLETFDKPCPPGHEACHGPGGQLDDRLSNLCWGTPSKNQGEDRVRDGTSNRGEQSVRSKLTEAIVLECRRRYAAGETQAALAIEFSISPESMGAAIRGYTWAHLTEGIPDPEVDGRSLISTPEMRERRREYGRKGAEKRWGK